MNGILDRIKRVGNLEEIENLRQEIETYKQASKKTINKFNRIAREKTGEFSRKG